MIIKYFNPLACLLFIILFASGMASAEGIKDAKSPVSVSNKLPVKFYSEITDKKKADIRKELGAELVKNFQEIRFEKWKVRIVTVQKALRYASGAALFPIKIITRLVIVFGGIFTFTLISLGYFLPFAILVYMIWNKNGYDKNVDIMR